MANGGIDSFLQDGSAIPNPSVGRYVFFWGLDGTHKKKDSAGVITDAYTGDKNFVFVQGVASASWVVAHNLSKLPSVTVVDSGGNEVEGEVLHTDNNNLTITFSAAFSGSAYIN